MVIFENFLNLFKIFLGPKRELVFQHASMNTNFNEIFLITSDQKKAALIDEINKDDADLFQIAFNKHCSKLHFNGDSGLIPYRILSTHVFIQRMSPTLYNYIPESEIDAQEDE